MTGLTKEEIARLLEEKKRLEAEINGSPPPQTAPQPEVDLEELKHKIREQVLQEEHERQRQKELEEQKTRKQREEAEKMRQQELEELKRKQREEEERKQRELEQKARKRQEELARQEAKAMHIHETIRSARKSVKESIYQEEQDIVKYLKTHDIKKATNSIKEINVLLEEIEDPSYIDIIHNEVKLLEKEIERVHSIMEAEKKREPEVKVTEEDTGSAGGDDEDYSIEWMGLEEEPSKSSSKKLKSKDAKKSRLKEEDAKKTPVEKKDELEKEEKQEEKSDDKSRKLEVKSEEIGDKKSDDGQDKKSAPDDKAKEREEILKHLVEARSGFEKTRKDQEKYKEIIEGKITETAKKISTLLRRRRIKEAMEEYNSLRVAFDKYPSCPEKSDLKHTLVELYDQISDAKKTRYKDSDELNKNKAQLNILFKQIDDSIRKKERVKAHNFFDQAKILYDNMEHNSESTQLNMVLENLGERILELDSQLAANKELASLVVPRPPYAEQHENHLQNKGTVKSTPAPAPQNSKQIPAAPIPNIKNKSVQAGPDQKQLDSMYAQGLECMYNDEKDKAVEIFRQILAVNPGNTAVKIRLQEAMST